MKDSQLICTWAMMFFAASLIATGSSAAVAWCIGMLCLFGGTYVHSQEKLD